MSILERQQFTWLRIRKHHRPVTTPIPTRPPTVRPLLPNGSRRTRTGASKVITTCSSIITHTRRFFSSTCLPSSKLSSNYITYYSANNSSRFRVFCFFFGHGPINTHLTPPARRLYNHCPALLFFFSCVWCTELNCVTFSLIVDLIGYTHSPLWFVACHGFGRTIGSIRPSFLCLFIRCLFFFPWQT